MSPKRWLLLLVFYISYLMFGASIYYHIEHGLETQSRAESAKEQTEINEYLVDQLADKNATEQTDILKKISDYCGKSVNEYSGDDSDTPYKWTFYHAFFFAFTVCSTVGYGNISPTTTLGRMIMIAYSIIGIPVNGILFAGLGEYFSKTFEAIYRRYKKYKMSRDVHYVPPQLGLITIVTIALVPGITIFLLLPSWVFTYFEDWSYSLAFYYAYVTTTTIGFGDYVPTFQPNQPRQFGGWFIVYEIFIIVWFIFSLGYLVMIMTFITRGLQSKKLARLEQQLSTNIKSTQNRIWSGVTKDVSSLRRVLNEMYILKFKPVYTEPDVSAWLHRSISCPELSMYRMEPAPIHYGRKRAFSECYGVADEHGENSPIVHASSDSELDKIDKQKSFETAEAFRHTTDLLAKVVTALATVKPPMEDPLTVGSAGMHGGYHGFSDSQILASEWSFPSVSEGVPKPRGRACSDFNINPKWEVRRPTIPPNEWTWSGDNNQIQQAINKRHKQSHAQDLYGNSFGQPDYTVNIEEDDELKKPRAKKFSVPESLRKIFPFRKRTSQEFISTSGADAPSGGRKYSIVSVPDMQMQHTAPLDYNSTVTADASPTFFRNGKQPAANNVALTFPSDTNIPAAAFTPRSNGVYDTDQTLNSIAATANAYQRNAAIAAGRRRRESIFTQNPALAARRASMFPSSSVAALSQRRGSFLAAERAAGATALQPRRGSLYPAAARLPLASSEERRPSLFSVASEQELEVLETTTIADLIRALETMHTQAVLDEAATSGATNQYSEMGGIFGGSDDKKKRKLGSAGLEAPLPPPLLSLFAGDNTRALAATAANRLYSRRSTIVSTMPNAPLAAASARRPSITNANPNVLTRRRPSTHAIVADLPPSYSSRDESATSAFPQASTTAGNRFRRRFSIRPTALQIPPGQAPPPGVSISADTSSTAGPTAAVPTPSMSTTSQSALQRRLSLRPSPLAREPNIPTAADAAVTGSIGIASSSTRLLPSNAGTAATRTPNPTSSTHSPLSRIAQISQAQRKSSMTDRDSSRL